MGCLTRTTRTCKKLSSESLKNQQGKIVITDQEKREMLAEISFPQQNPFQYVDNGPISAQTPLWEDNWAERVKRVIEKLPKNKSPGPDGVTEEFIRWLESITPGFMVPFVKRCIDFGYHPMDWKKAWGITIPKQGKSDYSKAKSYRTISLLNAIGKIV
jgi:hypothetical protein